MSDEIFYSGELATWKAWDDARKEWSTRLVTFEDYADGDPSTAIVTRCPQLSNIRVTSFRLLKLSSATRMLSEPS